MAFKTAAVIFQIVAVVAASSWIAAQNIPGNPDKGEAIYKEHCLRCHGRLGDGNGPDAEDLIVRPTNFHLPQSRAKSDFELVVAISNGVLFSPMHAWRGRLTDEQMMDVIAYVRALAPSSPYF